MGDPARFFDEFQRGGDRAPSLVWASGYHETTTPWTVGINYDLTREIGFYARASNAYRVSSEVNLILNFPGVTERAEQYELGAKYNTSDLAMFLTAYYTRYSPFNASALQFNPSNGQLETFAFVGETVSPGVQADIAWQPTNLFSLDAALTYQQPEYRNFENQTGLTALLVNGRQVIRTPKVYGNLRPTFHLRAGEWQLDAYLRYNFVGDRYVDYYNSSKLPGFQTLAAGVTASQGPWQWQLVGENITEAKGLTEGNPRSDIVAGQGTAEAVYGRPLLAAVSVWLRAIVGSSPISKHQERLAVRNENLKSLIAVCMALALHVSAFPQALAQSSTYQFIRTDEPLRDRNVYLLSVLQGDEVARKAVMEDAQLSRIGAAYRESVRTALSSCDRAVKCLIDALKLSDTDAEQAGAALERMAGPGKALDSAVRVHLRPSGAFQRFADLNDPQLVKAAWNSTVGALNRLYDVYAGGVEPRYPAIDSRLPSVNDDQTALMLRSAAEVALDERGQGLPFYTLWERIGLDLLVMNQRVRFEPLEEGENREALKRAASLKWQAFRYQAIVVPGAGLTDDERGLSAMGELRVRLAARRYRQGLAPFIIVSGGNVHPDRTPYNESVEMKRALMKRYGVPASAILVDPYARHTTTNLRNAERLLFRVGAGVGGDVLVTSSREQIDYIESPGFMTRCQNELGYVPHAVSSRPSPFDLIVRLDIRSLHQDPLDPLDP